MDNSKTLFKTEVVSVARDDSKAVSTFLSLGRDYFKEMPPERRGRFVQSILARLGEPHRWLLLLKCKNEHVGFAHVKIDRDERVGWGFILEFYIVPAKRRMGLGRTFFNFVENMLKTRGVKDIWLLTNSSLGESFWRSLGFELAEEKDEETAQNIMTKSLK